MKNKKLLFSLSSALVLGATFATSFGIASALQVKKADSASFSIGAETIKTKYYLVGSFNSWTESDEYELIDATSTMSEETGKIAEYKIKGLSLDKDATLKIKDSDGNWYADFEHKWTNPVSKDGEGNYKVLMTSNSYDFYLKLYEDSSSKIYIQANKDVMYFDPNVNAWNKDGAWFAVHYFDNDEDLGWEKLTTKSGSYYKQNVPAGANKAVYYRMDPGKSALEDSSKWNKSGKCNLSNTDVNNAFFLWEDAAWGEWTFSTSNVGSWTNM